MKNVVTFVDYSSDTEDVSPENSNPSNTNPSSVTIITEPKTGILKKKKK